MLFTGAGRSIMLFTVLTCTVLFKPNENSKTVNENRETVNENSETVNENSETVNENSKTVTKLEKMPTINTILRFISKTICKKVMHEIGLLSRKSSFEKKILWIATIHTTGTKRTNKYCVLIYLIFLF